jgi:signal transduction histidine kinase
MRRRSLSFRLFVYLFIVQMFLIVLQPIIVIAVALSGLNPEASANLNEWGEGYARQMVVSSLRRAPDASLLIEPTPALQAYTARSPSLQFAAWDAASGAEAAGSSPALLASLKPLWSTKITSLRFRLSEAAADARVGVLRRSQTPAGAVVVAIYGYAFGFSEWLFLVTMMLHPYGLAMFSPFVLPAAALAYFLVRRGLAPLRAAAQKAADIDLNSLDVVIPDADVPEEVAPFVTAVNDALKRVRGSIEAQQRFLANAAHELRTPITVLCSRIDAPEEATFMLDLKRDARRIKTIVEQLLSAARIAHDRDAIGEWADLRDIALTAILDYTPLAIASGRTIELERAKVPVTVRCDRHALERVVINLVENACRAEPEGGAVIVKVLAAGAIEFIDHGAGVAPQDRANVFEPFWRKSNSSPGTGLGLAISKEIVECHGGEIAIAETPGGGATFRMHLPLAA